MTLKFCNAGGAYSAADYVAAVLGISFGFLPFFLFCNE
jgi:hypothetical protein